MGGGLRGESGEGGGCGGSLQSDEYYGWSVGGFPFPNVGIWNQQAAHQGIGARYGGYQGLFFFN